LISGLDHVVVLIEDLEKGIASTRTLLGREPAWRGSSDGARTAVFTLDNMSLELMAPAGEGAWADRVRAALAQQGEGLASLCFRTDDIARMHRRLDRVALKPEAIAAVESRDGVTDTVLHWQRTRAATDTTRGVRLFFLELAQSRPLSPAIADAPMIGLDHIVVATQDPERAAALYGARLGLDLALDRSHTDWGQLMFFRCGDLIVEVVHRRNDKTDTTLDSARDRLWGLTWRVGDIEATRARLIAAGVDASEIRNGRKPGTRVLSLRNGTCGVPTLLLERSGKGSRE
jgi:catechol 2,3-dioxygenase-like lactoylglutathione lyase family enzyme